MKYTLNKKEKIKNFNKNINSEIKIVEFKNNKYLRRLSVDNPTERDKIEQYMNKILLKNNGGNSLFLKNYEEGPILETDINFLVGKEIIKRKIKISSCSKAGLSGPGIVKKNQDSYFIKENFMSNPDYFFLGVCDGHGDDGESISNLVASKLQTYITSFTNEEIISNFKKINSEIYLNSDINSDMSGTNDIYYSKNLSREHKPVELDESERIISGGGRLQKCFDKKTNKFFGPQRIWLKNEEQPGLAMTRSIGDKIAHNIGVIEEPEIKKFLYDGSEKFIIIASDGLWEYINGEQCINIVKKIYEEEKDAKKAAFELTKEAFKKWKRKEVVIDDITVIVIFFY
jgi:serine/threonine protein phosphatase PrpC